MNDVIVAICKVDGATTPAYKTAQAAGADLSAFIENTVVLNPGERSAIGTGISIALPPGFEAQIRPRSGLALGYGVTCLNTPGTIDADYRGEIKVILINLGQEPFTIKNGDRIAQLVVSPVSRADFSIVESLDSTVRGSSGFGSTGI